MCHYWDNYYDITDIKNRVFAIKSSSPGHYCFNYRPQVSGHTTPKPDNLMEEDFRGAEHNKMGWTNTNYPTTSIFLKK